MKENIDETMGTQPVRIDTGILNMVREVKEKIGFPIQRFIEDAIVHKLDKLPKHQKEKLSLFSKPKPKK